MRVLSTIPPEIRDKVVGDHAGGTETSLLMHLRPETVDLGALRTGDYWYSWVPGRESKGATAATGEQLLGLMVASLSDAILAASDPESQ